MKLLVLDRDGVINFDGGYVHTRQDFIFEDGIFEFCQLAIEKGYEIAIATNQAGIARGFYSLQDFHDLTTWMLGIFASKGIAIAQVYFCPHHPDFGDSDSAPCECRKPNPGMLNQARALVPCQDNECIIVGDKGSDMLAGINANFAYRVGISETPLLGATHNFASVRKLAAWASSHWFTTA